MKLIYMYIESLNTVFSDIFFDFSNEYRIEYDKFHNKIQIRNNSEYFRDFYGKCISDITAIVGKNGSGKSTILETIGRDIKERIELLRVEGGELKDRYFMLFHVEKNLFYFEGIGITQIENIVGVESRPEASSQIVRSFYFQQIEIDSYTVVSDYEREIQDRIIYMREDLIKSTSNSSILFGRDRVDLIPRVTASTFSWVDWYNIYLDLFQKKILQSPNVHILFQTSTPLKETKNGLVIPSVREGFGKRLGGILTVEEELMEDFLSRTFYLLLNYIAFLGKKILSIEQQNEFLIINRKQGGKVDYLLYDYLKLFDKYFEVFEQSENFYPKEASLIMQYITHVKEYFRALYQVKSRIITGVDEFKLVIPSLDKDGDILGFLDRFTKLRDFIAYHFDYEYIEEDTLEEELYPRYSDRRIQIKMPCYIHRVELSTGEKKILELLSITIHEIYENTLNQKMRLLKSSVKKNIVFLIDEIESTMHLEWSRNFINYVISYLDEMIVPIDLGGEKYVDLGINVQLIMTTHSPFLLSDLNQNSIIALECVEGVVYKKDSVKSFAQNIQRIMNNEFFIRDSYGAFAQNKINEIIKLCDEKEKLTENDKKKIKYVIEEVGEPILKKKLEEKFIEKLKKDSDIKAEERFLLEKIKQMYGNITQEDFLDRMKNLLNDSE